MEDLLEKDPALAARLELLAQCLAAMTVDDGDLRASLIGGEVAVALAVADRVMPGFGEQMRQVSLAFVPTAILSRQVAVIRKRTLIVNLPGQPKAIEMAVTGRPGLSCRMTASSKASQPLSTRSPASICMKRSGNSPPALA